MTPTQITKAAIVGALDGGNATMAKRFLQFRGLVRGARDTVDELAQRIVGYVTDKKLTNADVATLVRETLECGAKRVYLMRGTPTAMRRVKSSKFGEAAINSLDDARVRLLPAQPTTNYAVVTDKEIRVSYSETHTRISVDRRTRHFEEVKQTRVIVIHADLSSGLVTVALDPPATVHPHGDTPSSYFTHFLGGQAPMVSGSKLEDVDLAPALEALGEERHRGLVRSGLVRGLGKDGVELRVNGGLGVDLRDSETYLETQSTLAMRTGGVIVWKTSPSSDPAAIMNGDALLREVHTDIIALPALVRFPRHTLSNEMKYVIDQLISVA